tara:strand:- start:184 stop:585 length:402 start_codon:yes stop_codon:yes gene_type:complete
MKSSPNTAMSQVQTPAPVVEGNKGFTYSVQVNTASLGTTVSFEAARKAVITARIPRQVQLCMNAWLTMSNGSGFVELDKLNDNLIGSGKWVRASGKAYNQDPIEILSHYQHRITGDNGWGKKGATIFKLGAFK